MEKINLSQNTLNILNKNKIITDCIKKHEFLKAYKLILNIDNEEQKNNYLKKINEETKNYIDNSFLDNNVATSKLLVENFLKKYPLSNKNDIITYYNDKLNFYTKIESYKCFLELFDFQSADELFLKNKNLKICEYEHLKSEYICKYFAQNHNILINKEQAIALSKIQDNILIRARAGSGKTRTIACKAIYAIEKEKLKPEEILILAFNKNAAEEIKDRITEQFNYKKIDTNFIRTFHSLAHRIVGNTDKDILYDDSSKYSSHKLTNFIEQLYHTNGIWDEDFKNNLYIFYKANEEPILDDIFWQFRTQEEKYNYLRHQTYYTLNGEKVKSFGEKFIANFLFEHDIKYKYEQVLMQKNHKQYKPDFTILYNNKKFILEHWGIDESDVLKEVPKEWTKSWDEYHEEMLWKRERLTEKIQNGDIENFIETSIKEFNQGEVFFEKFLANLLESSGIMLNKLSHAEIINKMERAHKFDEVAKKFAQFIQAAKKSQISPLEIDARLKKINLSERSKIFIRLVNKIYKKYDEQLELNNKTDFDNILEEAIAIIHNTRGNCQLLFDDKCYKIKDLKLIMIDEYQDFSRLFFELIQAIRKYNPALKLYCVGDDWQAINGFAGSDLKYFNEFTDIFSKSAIANLIYNYRSGEKIIKISNGIMKNFGIPALCFNTSIESKVVGCNIANMTWDIKQDKDFMYDSSFGGYFAMNHRYLKKCYEIISNDPSKSYIIMHRTSLLNNYHELTKFSSALNYVLTKNHIHTSVEVNTIHSFKGREADCVIILEFSEWYPLVHPDNEFYFILGRTPQNVLDEERRLLYVAFTRAKENVYIVQEFN